MSSFNEICTDVGRLANKAAKKTGELAHSASLHIKLEGVKGKISSSFEKLGRLTYKQLKSGESQTEKIAEVISSIDCLREQESSLRKQIEALKEKNTNE